jgi:hypothetical protein
MKTDSTMALTKAGGTREREREKLWDKRHKAPIRLDFRNLLPSMVTAALIMHYIFQNCPKSIF